MTKYYRIKNEEEFNWLMEHLEETTDYAWGSGSKPTDIKFKDNYSKGGGMLSVYDGRMFSSSAKIECAISVVDLKNKVFGNVIKNGKQFDSVEKPSHYNQGKFEVIDVIEDWNLGFHLGNVVKYVARNEHKENPLEDLKKAKYYLDRKIEELE